MSAPEESLSDRERRLGEVVAECLRAIERGEVVSQEEWTARYPDLATDLQEFFQNEQTVANAAAALRSAVRRETENDLPFAVAMRSELTQNAAPRGFPREFGEYELLGTLGYGGMGVVYRARKKNLDREVALKMISPNRLPKATDAQRFRQEAEVVARLDHPHIAPIYDVGEYDGQPYFTMKLMEGGSLDGYLERFRDDSRQAVRLMIDVAGAVCHAHQRGIVHRDLKPSNILLDEAGRAYVTDFGLAKYLTSDRELTCLGELLGTPAYMAPELAAGRSDELSAATDVYGLGAILYALLTGLAPFRGLTVAETIERVIRSDPDPPSSVNRGVDRDLQTICLKCLEKQPARRYHCPSRLADDLQRWLDGRPVLARPISRAAKSLRWCRRNAIVSSLTAALVLLLGAVAVFLLISNQSIGRANAVAEQGQRNAREEARRLNRFLYSANIRLASVAWKNTNLPEMRKLLDRSRPAEGQEDLRGFEWYYLAGLEQKEMVTLRAHQGAVYVARFSPDGRTLASAGSDGTAILWDLTDNTPRHRLTGHAGEINNLCFSPDGATLATASDDTTVKLWVVATGLLRATVAVSDQPVFGVGISPDGRTLAAGGKDNIIHLVDLATLQLTTDLRGHAHHVESLVFSPDGKTLASASSDNSVRLWDLATGQTLLTLLQHASFASAVAFAHQTPLLASGEHDGKIVIWDLHTGQPRVELSGPVDAVRSVEFSPDDRTLLSASRYGTVRFWNVATGQQVGAIRVNVGGVWSAVYSPDGQVIASTGEDGTVRLWDRTAGMDFAPVPIQEDWIPRLEFSLDGKHLLTGGFLAFWDLTTLTQLPRHPDTRNRAILEIALSHDGRLLATGGLDGTVELRAPDSGRVLSTLGTHATQVAAVEFSPDDRWLVSTGEKFSVILWDVAAQKQRWALPADSERVLSLAFSPDGTLLVGIYNGRLRFWSVASGQPVTPLTQRPDNGSISCVRFSPDGTLLAVAEIDRAIHLWDIVSDTQIAVLVGHLDQVRGLCFSPDGRRLASCSRDGTVRIWDLGTYQELLTLEGHNGPVDRVKFSPDGRVLASASYPESPSVLARPLLLWRADTAGDAR